MREITEMFRKCVKKRIKVKWFEFFDKIYVFYVLAH